MEKNPEKKPKLKDNCNACGKNYRITPDNAAWFDYSQKPEVRVIVCKCTHCEFVTTIYCPETSNTLDVAREMGIQGETRDWPSDNVLNNFYELIGLELIEPRAITPRQEKLVSFVGWLLEEELLKPDDFIGEGELVL